MCAKYDKSGRIFWIEKKIDTIDNTCQEKDTIIEQSEIYRYSEHICNPQSEADKGCVEEDSCTQVEWLFKGIIFWQLLFEEFRPAEEIEWGYNLWNKDNPDKNHHPHFDISVIKEKNARKNAVYQGCEK